MYSVHFPCWAQGNIKVIIFKGNPKMVRYTAWTIVPVCNKLQSTRAALLKCKRQEQELIALALNQGSPWCIRHYDELFSFKQNIEQICLSVTKSITTKTQKRKRKSQLIRELGGGQCACVRGWVWCVCKEKRIFFPVSIFRPREAVWNHGNEPL